MSKVPTYLEIRKELHNYKDSQKAAFYPRFFKTGVGEYGEGDHFIGITVPNIRIVAKKYAHVELSIIEQLLSSPIHEERLLALLLLVNQYKKSKCDQQRKEIFDFYLSHINQINNWDLVDSSAPYIVGEYLADSDDRRILIQLAHSPNLWQRRIAILSTLAFLKRKDPSSTIEISTILLTDTHDLIHKAVGWMLREMGKRVSEKKLTDFLDQHAAIMPRTMLRYSLEKLTEQQIKKYMTVTKNH